VKMKVILLGALALSTIAVAQQGQQPATKLPEVRETVVVVGAPDPVTEQQSQRSTAALEAQPVRLTVGSATELVRDDASVDLEQRGGGDTQADLSIRGSSYEQTLVLLNGLRINDAETSHFNLDLPVPFDALGGMYVLHGAGSTLYGSDAVSGAVNITTMKPDEGWDLRLRAGGGSFGGNTQAAVASYARGSFSEVAAGGRDFSDGFIADRDYRSEEADSETRFHSALGDSDVLLAGSDRAFGADQFYGPYNSWERTKGWFAALTQQIDTKTSAALAYRRHSDDFVLNRGLFAPTGYENHHIDSSWQGIVRRRDDIAPFHTRFDYGLDVNADQIASSSLGDHGRNRGAGYLMAQSSWKQAVASVGLREEIVGGGPSVFVPSFSLSDFLRPSFKLRGAVSRGFRMPTYTDLYYSDPATQGNPNLKPEYAWSDEAGFDWYPGKQWMISVTGFTSSQTNVIDYVRANPNDLWHAENLTHVRLTGMEFSTVWHPTPSQEVRVGLTTLSGASSATGLQSEYAFSFPKENAVMAWNARWKHGVTTREQLRVVHRIDGQLYPVFDSSLAYESWRVHPYLQMTNLNNASYQEAIGVPMQGRAFAAGLEIELSRKR
jgi:vitamin B12 transporter